jgi:hypothetical protein
MSASFKDRAQEAGHKIAEKASEMGHRVSEKAEEAADWAKEKAHQAGNRMAEAAEKVKHKVEPLLEGTASTGSAASIREHQDVYASCGTKVGKVDRVEGSFIKLTRSDSPDGQHHRIPLAWVAKVGDRVELDRDHFQVQREWQPA